jgi:hypothetical protein
MANEFFKAIDATINFVPDSVGFVEQLIIRNNGQSWDAKKLKDETPVKVNPDIFDKLTGEYNLGNNYSAPV